MVHALKGDEADKRMVAFALKTDNVPVDYRCSVLLLRGPDSPHDFVLMTGMIPPTHYGPVLLSVGDDVSQSDIRPYTWPTSFAG